MLPQDFLDEMKSLLGGEYEEFLKSYDMEKVSALRLNPLKNHDIINLTQAFGLTEVEWQAGGFYYDPEKRPGKSVYHEAGAYYVQEPSAMIPAEYLKAEPGEYILDLCAAPGGKSTQIAGRMQGKGILVSNEIVPQRAKILAENIERMGIKNAVVTNMDPHDLSESFPEFFDRIMVDAPCSGEGMFRKNEDATGEWSRENVHMCAGRQDDILSCAAKMLAPGGRMVYSTCTFSIEENEGTIERFLAEHPDFHTVGYPKQYGMRDGFGNVKDGIRCFPHLMKGEGHFVCVLEKAGVLPDRDGRLSKGSLEKGIREKSVPEYTEFAAKYLEEKPQGVLIKFGERLFVIPDGMPSLKGLKIVRPGLEIGTVKKGRFEPAHALSHALDGGCFKLVEEISYAEAERYIRGETFRCDGENGWYLISCEGYGISWGKLAGGTMKNHYPKGLRKNL